MSCIIRFVGPEAYVSGKYGWTILTGSCVATDHGHALHLINKFPGQFELVTEEGDEVLAEGNIRLDEPFDGTPVDEEDDEETESEDKEQEPTGEPAETESSSPVVTVIENEDE